MSTLLSPKIIRGIFGPAGFPGFTFNGAEVGNFATTRTLKSSNPINFAPGTSLFLSVDMNAVTGGDNEVIIGCYSGAFGGGKGWVLERGQNTGTFNLLNWAGTYDVIGVQRLGVRLFAFRWQASDSHVWLSVDGAAAVDLGALTAPTMDGSCVSVIGTAAGVASVTDGPFLTGGVIDFALIGTELSDANLAASTLVTSGSRFATPALFSNPIVDFNAFRDWDGITSTFATQGSAPVTFTVVGAISRTDISEVYYAAIDGMFQDSKISVNETTHTRRNTYARIRAVTSGLRAAIHQVSSIQASYGGHYAAIGVLSNGVYHTEGQNTVANAEQITDVTLPAGSNKNIDFVEGDQALVTGNIKGTFINALRLPVGSIISPTTAPAKQIIFVGDSALDGFLATIPQAEGSILIVRASYYANIANCSAHAVGSMGLYHLTVDAPTLAASAALIASMCVGTSTNLVYIELGANDYYSSLISAATYQTKLAALVDAVKVLVPGVTFLFQTPTPLIAPSNENANGFGDTLGAYRTAMTNVYSTRTAFSTLLDGTTIISAANYNADGIHPNTAGHAEIAGYIETAIGY